MSRFLMLLAVLLLAAQPIGAKPVKKQVHGADASHLLAEGRFSAAERHIIRTGILAAQQDMGDALPQGVEKRLASGKRLPPGWQKKLARGKRLDFHAYRAGTPLPGSVTERLPPSATGMELIRIGNEILRLQTGTHIVLDYFQLLQQ